jgi:hypothetical protein
LLILSGDEMKVPLRKIKFRTWQITRNEFK